MRRVIDTKAHDKGQLLVIDTWHCVNAFKQLEGGYFVNLRFGCMDDVNMTFGRREITRGAA